MFMRKRAPEPPQEDRKHNQYIFTLLRQIDLLAARNDKLFGGGSQPTAEEAEQFHKNTGMMIRIFKVLGGETWY